MDHRKGAAWRSQSTGNGAFYVNRYDAGGAFITDTWHQTFAAAKEQALDEYEGKG